MNAAPSDSWRSWLMTGNRGLPADRRRVRGANRGLKKMLAEGMGPGGDRPWKDFSGAMVRQAVNEALNQLPPEHVQVVKLAYFAGMSNREIAGELGLSVGGVQRRLRQALSRIGDHVEHGRRVGRHAVYVVLGWLAARQLIGVEHMAGALVIAAATTTLAIQSPATVSAAPTPATAVQAQAANPPSHHARPAPTGPAAGHDSPPIVSAPALPAAPAAAPALPLNVPPLPAVPVRVSKLPASI